MSAAVTRSRWWFRCERRTWRNIKFRSYGSLQHDSRDRNSRFWECAVMGFGQDILSGEQLLSQLNAHSGLLSTSKRYNDNWPISLRRVCPWAEPGVNKTDCEEAKTTKWIMVMKRDPASNPFQTPCSDHPRVFHGLDRVLPQTEWKRDHARIHSREAGATCKICQKSVSPPIDSSDKAEVWSARAWTR